jgi:hypothetical protein
LRQSSTPSGANGGRQRKDAINANMGRRDIARWNHFSQPGYGFFRFVLHLRIRLDLRATYFFARWLSSPD